MTLARFKPYLVFKCWRTNLFSDPVTCVAARLALDFFFGINKLLHTPTLGVRQSLRARASSFAPLADGGAKAFEAVRICFDEPELLADTVRLRGRQGEGAAAFCHSVVEDGD